MLRRIFTAFFTVLGGIAGYVVFELCCDLLANVDEPYIQTMLNEKGSQLTWFGVFFVFIFTFIFFRLAPVITKKSRKVANTIENDVQYVSTNDLIGGTVGLIAGMIISFFLTQIYSDIIEQKTLQLGLSIIVYVSVSFLGAVIGKTKISEMLTMMENNRKAQSQGKGAADERGYTYSAKDKKSSRMPKILDTSVIIDGRILEIMKTGFFEGPVVIPEFVLVELRHIADSSDGLKRNRGRRGLDILNKIQTEYGIEIYNTDSEKALKEIPEVDVKLLKLAQIMKGKVVTNDFNLNKVATIKGVPVLNINELANALKPMVIPGEDMTVTLIKQGKDSSQAVAYLDDGTMIVVEDGRKLIGKTVDIVVTSVLQTAAGRMIFGRSK